ncbi:MAG: DNA protecting protein DprA [Candidatus Woykebacteria bacterium RIFCSPLOWO2_01_FULL_43_14]|uniref:DNA protecting protein DprA n=2 Tax=Candidatus Woykeibacteriota TaxID=1817899 RepID=A0A1G1WY24_9BACT|nr:MAG: DNA protecting protein DprA [Candidatus Woykebacteria bacterium RIFCSPHIGHO2_02_FULL_43_16b]OGY32629.1 MAG: DNA protecting protein DprA [Candidatus Woykebacteria bacterium RIFCSPLOWO2_01_FULL_43_14]
MDKEELKYLVAISSISGIGSARLKVLIDVLKNPSDIWKATERDINELLGPKIASQFLQGRSQIDPDSFFSKIQQSNVSIITAWDDLYPALLKEISDPPPILYYKGDLRCITKKSIAIVGTRLPTSYGREVTEHFARELTQHGFCIVSGLARGVDSLAHTTTLENNGITIAVLGGGLNCVYPAENKGLSDRVAQSGVLLSEFPPDFPPNPGTFPARNRIISGLSKGVLITEAAEDSGSLITADCALEQNREVFAVPGPVFSKQSQGTAKVIKQGGKMVTAVQDILDELGFDVVTAPRPAYVPVNDLENAILDSLADSQVHIDELIRNLAKPSHEISSCLSLLEVNGAIRNLGSGMYKKTY